MSGAKLFGYAVLTTFIVMAIFPLYSTVENADSSDFTGNVSAVSVEEYTIDSNWTSPPNGTIEENTCESNGEISPEQNESCEYEIRYDTSDFEYGDPYEIEYLANLGDGNGTWEVEVQKSGSTENIIDGYLNETVTPTTETIDAEPDSRDRIDLTYTLEDPEESNTTEPSLEYSELRVNGDDDEFSFGLTEQVLTVFTMLVFVGGSALILWLSA